MGTEKDSSSAFDSVVRYGQLREVLTKFRQGRIILPGPSRRAIEERYKRQLKKHRDRLRADGHADLTDIIDQTTTRRLNS